MAITTINNRAINRADTAASGESWTATSATASDFQAAVNTPSFHVLKDASQSVSNSTSTVITWQTESWDTNSAFASNKFTVPSGEGGKYFIYASLVIDGLADGKTFYSQIRKNGYNFINSSSTYWFSWFSKFFCKWSNWISSNRLCRNICLTQSWFSKKYKRRQ